MGAFSQSSKDVTVQNLKQNFVWNVSLAVNSVLLRFMQETEALSTVKGSSMYMHVMTGGR